jgi:DDE superfamily endonuclease
MPLWASEVRPGSTHDITAARELVLPGLRPWLKAFPCLADSGYEGAGARVLVPVRRPRKGGLDTDAKCRSMLPRSMLPRGLRYQGERGFALRKERWRALQHVTVSPTQIGDIVKAALVLTQFEHKMIS